jgi:hypothetical protein
LHKTSLALIALSVGLFSASQAKASTSDLFTLTGDGNIFTFSLTSPSTPSSCQHAGDVCYTTTVLDHGTNSQTDTIEFTSNDGLDIYDSKGNIVDLNLNNKQPDFFSDSHGVVTIDTGKYDFTGDDNGWGGYDWSNIYRCGNGDNGGYTLNITDPPPASPVPEPSSLVLMSSGLLAAAGAVRRRFKK